MLFADLADASADVAASSARSAKTARLAAVLARAADQLEAQVAVHFLTGATRQRRTGIGWAALRELPAPAAEPSLTILGVDQALDEISGLSGAGSATARRSLLSALLAAATAGEQRFLTGIVSGELRQGALDGVVLDAVIKATGLPAADLRQAVMLGGSLPEVAAAALIDGGGGIARFRLEVGRGVLPMLAQPAGGLADAVGVGAGVAVDAKLDGVRVQLHRDGADVRVFTRTLDDITARVPEVVSAALAMPATRFILDGEAIALGPSGRPRPFQETSARVARRSGGVGEPLTTYVFDLLHLDGADTLALPARERFAIAAEFVPARVAVPRCYPADADEAAAFLAQTLADGHEGVVVKALDAPYDAGRRGGAWRKIKPVHTLDLVVLAAEWGHGRRKGLLSNLHLGARDPAGGFVMLGKTFKGLTDELLRWQTERLLALAEGPTDGWVVPVRPELVVEIAFDGVQTSPRYPGGMALRFARVVRYRADKSADAADTIDDVRAVYDRGVGAE